MATVISREGIDKHNVQKYSFKVIALGQTATKLKEQNPKKEDPSPSDFSQKSEIDSSALSTSSKDSLIESLMKKTDEMSSNFIKLQMRLEQKEEEFAQELQKAKEEAFKEGVEAGKAQAKKEIDGTINHSLELFTKSIQKLENAAEEFQHSLSGLKKELLGAALDIAHEVVQVELSQNSHKIAETLSRELIQDLQSASNVTLKVNPKDFAYIMEHLGTLKNINIIAESAVSEGGVVVISDAGNIDAQISKRFERVKKAALSE